MEQPFTFDTNTIFLPRNIYINISDRIYSFCPKAAAGAADRQQIGSSIAAYPRPFSGFFTFLFSFPFCCELLSYHKQFIFTIDFTTKILYKNFSSQSKKRALPPSITHTV